MILSLLGLGNSFFDLSYNIIYWGGYTIYNGVYYIRKLYSSKPTFGSEDYVIITNEKEYNEMRKELREIKNLLNSTEIKKEKN